MDNAALIGVVLAGAVLSLTLLGMWAAVRICYRKVPEGQALVTRVILIGARRVRFGRAVVYPILQRAERVDLTEKRINVTLTADAPLPFQDGALCAAELQAVVTIPPNDDDVLGAVDICSAEKTFHADAVGEVLAPRIAEAARRAASGMNASEVLSDRKRLTDRVIAAGADLGGFVLRSVSLESFRRLQQP